MPGLIHVEIVILGHNFVLNVNAIKGNVSGEYASFNLILISTWQPTSLAVVKGAT